MQKVKKIIGWILLVVGIVSTANIGSVALAQFGILSEVKKPDETILHSADLTPNPEYKNLRGDMTHGVVVRRVDNKTIELGVGTKLQIAFIAQGEATSTLGYPGSRVTLQPGSSIVWQGNEVSPKGKDAVTFEIVEKNGKLSLSVEGGGTLKYIPRTTAKPK